MEKQQKIEKIIELLMNNHQISQEKKAEIFDTVQVMNSSSLDVLIDFLDNFTEEGADEAIGEISRRKTELNKYSEKVLRDAKKEILEIAENEEEKDSEKILEELNKELI